MKKRISSVCDQVDQLMAQMIGQYTWNVRCVNDRMLHLEFGKPRLVVHEPLKATGPRSRRALQVISRRVVLPAGAYRMFIEDGFWEVNAGGLRCTRADVEQNADFIMCLAQLSGQKLEGASFNKNERQWMFNFDLAGELIIRGGDKLFAESSLWKIHFDNGNILSFLSENEAVLQSKSGE